MDAVVHDRRVVADDLVVLLLRRRDGGELPPWSPGAHVDLVLPPGTRQYSLCGDPDDRRTWRLGVLREPHGRGVSRYVHDTLAVGDDVRLSLPRNHFPLVPAARYLFIAGGVGITPLLPMIRAADAASADWTLVYGGRRRESMGFLPELARHGDRVRLHPQDEFGLIDLDALFGQLVAGEQVYCCGPESLLVAVESRRAGVNLHVERFSPRAATEPVEDRPFQVVLAASGVTVDVPAGVSILDAVAAAGVAVDSSCEEGTCGTCETPVIEGVPDHRDSVLDDAERAAGDTMMICVSRCQGHKLVLDL